MRPADLLRRTRSGTAASTSDAGARTLAWLCLLLAIALPLATAWYLFDAWPQGLLRALDPLRPKPSPMGLPIGKQITAAALALLPVLAMSVALVRAYRCLSAFARGDCFTPEAVREMRAFAALVFVAGVAGALVPSAIVLLLTLGGPGQATLALSIGTPHVFLLLFSAITWRIAAVLARAVALADENALFV